jgi:ferredoxin
MIKEDRYHKETMFLEKPAIQDLIDQLIAQGYRVIAPKLVEEVVHLREIKATAEIPVGVEDQQQPGYYRTGQTESNRMFDYVVGPESPKRYLSPMIQKLMSFHVEEKRFVLDEGPRQPDKFAFLGIRPCELAAVHVQDRVYGYDDQATFRCESEPLYNESRRNAIFIVVNCTQPGGTCFCTSMGTGPQAKSDFDLALTELDEGFVLETGSNRGRSLADHLPLRPATSTEVSLANANLEMAAGKMGRQLDTEGMVDLLNKSVDHPHWDEVAERCLSCANCTMVCPTCFCSTVTDSTDLTGKQVTRQRKWESCFNPEFSYVVGGPQRGSTKAKYRHWLRHKLATWWEQFGTSGCVGCGRCITWCPVGIDLTEEVDKLRKKSSVAAESEVAP